VDTVLKLVISGVIMWEWREGNREIELYSWNSLVNTPVIFSSQFCENNSLIQLSIVSEQWTFSEWKYTLT
jgi:hypothetical protein